MLLETFRGPDLTALFRQACAELGDDALIVRTRVVGGVRRREFEVVTTTPRSVTKLRARMRSFPLPSVQQHRVSRRPPFMVALVGPEGGARTMTLAMLASDVDAFAEWNCGVLAVSTSPSAMLGAMATSSVLRDLPVEVASSVDDLEPALNRLASCDAILVQTQDARSSARTAALVRAALEALAPDETHLVLPAATSPQEAADAVDAFRATRPSHLLLADTRGELDESAMLSAVSAAKLPIRWVAQAGASGMGLRPAAERILGGLRLDAAPAASGAGAMAW